MDEPVYIYDLPEEEVKHAPAPFLRRLGALLIDSVIFYFLFFQIFFLIYGSMTGIPIGGSPETYGAYLLSNTLVFQKLSTGFFASGFIMLFYMVVAEKYLGASIGEKLFKLKMVSIDKKEVSFGRLVLRNLSKSVLLPFIIIDIIPALFTPTKQRYLELFSRTRTLYVPGLNLIYEGYA